MKLISAGRIAFAIAIGVIGTSAQTAEQHLQKCDASYAKSKYSDAVKHCTKAIEARPGFEEALITRAAAYKNVGNDNAAIADYTEVIRLTDGMAMAYFYRAGVYEKLGRIDDAIADLTASVTRDPKGLFAARSHYQRGLLYDRIGKGDAAQADYWSAVRLKPDYAQAKAKIKNPFGDLTLTEAANRIIPGVATPELMARQSRPRYRRRLLWSNRFRLRPLYLRRLSLRRGSAWSSRARASALRRPCHTS